MSTKTCAMCAYFDNNVVQKNVGHAIQGVCRVRPPTIVLDGIVTVFPMVKETEWCGEHKEKEIPTDQNLS